MVNQILVPHGVVVTSASTDANIVIEQSQPIAAPITTMLNNNPCYPPVGVPLNNTQRETRVTFSLSLVPQGATSAWGARQGVPNWLSVFGFSLGSASDSKVSTHSSGTE